MTSPRKPHIDLGLELLANARQELAARGVPGADAPLTNVEVAGFISEVTGLPVTPESIGNDARRAISKLRRHSARRGRWRELDQL